MPKPICQQCVAEEQLFKQCHNPSAGTVLQRCSCLSGVETLMQALCCRGAAVFYVVSLPICQALCCRGAAVKAVLQPYCRHCAAGVQLFKWCRNLSARTVLQRCSCLSGVETYLPTLWCSCLGGVETYLLALCCRGAAV